MKPKEFFSRWKGGIEAITPLQQLKVTLMSSVLVLIGIIIGLITTFILRTWWLFVVLLGSLFMSVISFIGTLQKYWALKKIDDMIKGQEKETIEGGTMEDIIGNIKEIGMSDNGVKLNGEEKK